MICSDTYRDILQQILGRLDLRHFIAASLVSRAWSVAAYGYACSKGLIEPTDLFAKECHRTLQRDLITSFTCPCGRAEWDVAAGCKCWVECWICKRQLPCVLTDICPIKDRRGVTLRYCTYPCRIKCDGCGLRNLATTPCRFSADPIMGAHIYCVGCWRAQTYTEISAEEAKGIIAYRNLQYFNRNVAVVANYDRLQNTIYIDILKRLLIERDPQNPLLTFL